MRPVAHFLQALFRSVVADLYWLWEAMPIEYYIYGLYRELNASVVIASLSSVSSPSSHRYLCTHSHNLYMYYIVIIALLLSLRSMQDLFEEST